MKIHYRLGPPCSGKTYWLCNIVKEYSNSSRPIIYYSSKSRIRHFYSFDEKYRFLYTNPVEMHAVTNIQEIEPYVENNPIIIIDELLEHPYASEFIHCIRGIECDIFVTITEEIENNKDANSDEYEQLTLWR